jgi:thiol-disulfide isomerase/thioredoxin
MLGSCVRVENNFSKLPPGIWRGTLQLAGEQFSNPIEDNSEISTSAFNDSKGELPFNFEVFYSNDTTIYIEIINGEERIRIDDIKYGRDNQTAKDTVLIEFNEFDSYIEAIFVENKMEGHWVVNYRENYRIPFTAIYGQHHRFNTLGEKPNHLLTGIWQTEFEINEENPYPAKAIFEQNGEALTGTFLTETGDYRYLAGDVQGDKLFLSCFDGAHAFLFEAKVLADSSIYGIFKSGSHYTTEWTASRNKDFKLQDPYELTKLKDSTDSNFDKIFENIQIDQQDSNWQKFKSSKVKLVQFMGTWCPNCKDEAIFLKKYSAENPNQDLSIIGLCFERYRDSDIALNKIESYASKMDLPYALYYGGYYNKKEVSNAFPMLNEIIAYPTLLFINKDNEIVKIHTGFSGPATDEFNAFSADFNETIQKLLNE